MASEASETIADIVAEMRGRKEMLESAIYSAPICYSTDNQKAQVEIIDEFLDRIEAAAKRAYNAIDSVVCGIEDISHYDIDDVRKAMEKTIGDYYE